MAVGRVNYKLNYPAQGRNIPIHNYIINYIINYTFNYIIIYIINYTIYSVLKFIAY